MDPELFLDFANTVRDVHMYPYFDIAHYALSCIHVRHDMASNVQLISRKHPLACWISCMVSCFAGYIIANFLLGEPILAPFKSMDNVGLASLVWYLIFYSPFDVVYKLCKTLPVKAVLSVMKEMQRVYKVYHGVEHTAKIYPHAYIVQIIIGTVKGAGAGFTQIFERFVRGTWTPTGHEFLHPTFERFVWSTYATSTGPGLLFLCPTKACLAAAVVFVLEDQTSWITAPHSVVYLAVVIFFVYFKLSSLFLHMNDPFQPLENLFCAVFMGGVWDALSRAVQVSREKAAEAANGEVDKKK